MDPELEAMLNALFGKEDTQKQDVEVGRLLVDSIFRAQQDVTRVADPTKPREQQGRIENILMNIISGGDPTFGIVSQAARLTPDRPITPLMLAAGFLGGGLGAAKGVLKGTLKLTSTMVKKSNFLRPLKQIANKLFRETSLDDLEEFIPGGRISREFNEVFFSNTPDLALGQGRSKGVLLEFATDNPNLQGKVNTSKPGWEVAFDNDAAEVIARHVDQKVLKESLLSITIKPGAQASNVTRRRLPPFLAKLEVQGWTKTVLEDGTVKITRK